MSMFCYKNLEATTDLSTKLKERREKSGLKISEVAGQLHMPSKYLEALEEGRFCDLPKARGYRLAYVREYAKALGLEPESCAEKFCKEQGLVDAPTVHPHKGIKLFPFSSISIFLRNIVLAGFALLFAGYLMWQVRGILEPPKLTIYSPIEGDVSNRMAAVVQGQTEKESRLTINGQEIMVNESGHFETKLDLTEGVNTIVISATKKHGKTTTITRHIVVKQTVQQISVGLKKTINN